MQRVSRTTRSLSLAAGTILAATALAGCGQISSLVGGAQRDADTHEVTEEGTDSVFDIRVGDCLQEPDASSDEVTDVTVVPCDGAHDYELYDEFDLTTDDDQWPGMEQLSADADGGCYDAFETFVGVPFDESESLWYTYYHPTEQSWAEGDRAIQCLIYEASDSRGMNLTPVEGSLEGAAR